jgi:hypothetical protein
MLLVNEQLSRQYMGTCRYSVALSTSIMHVCHHIGLAPPLSCHQRDGADPGLALGRIAPEEEKTEKKKPKKKKKTKTAAAALLSSSSSLHLRLASLHFIKSRNTHVESQKCNFIKRIH